MRLRDCEGEWVLGFSSAKPTSSLGLWYMSVRDIPIEDLGVGDLCRALRQDLFVEEILPSAVLALNEDPLAGERYDGELIYALSRIAGTRWKSQENSKAKVIESLRSVEQLTDDVELLNEARMLVAMLEQ